MIKIFTHEFLQLICYNHLQNRPRKCNGFDDCMLEDDWEWIGSSTMPSQKIEPSHQASVDLLEIRKPTNCVTVMARITLPSWTNVYELQDQDCDHKNWIVCTINYGSAGLGASIGNNIEIYISTNNSY